MLKTLTFQLKYPRNNLYKIYVKKKFSLLHLYQALTAGQCRQKHTPIKI